MTKFLPIALLVILIVFFCACHRDTPAPSTIKPLPTGSTIPTGSPDDLISQKGQLISKAESQEEAESIAELYGITLLEFKHNMALYHTEEDPREVIKRGQENGWPELSLNHIAKPF